MESETKEKETDPLDLIEHDPITLAKSQRDRIIACELSTRLPDEYHAEVLHQPKAELERRIRSAIERFRIDQIDGALTDFAQSLRSAVAFELANNPALKPWSAADEIKNNSTAFFAEHWNGNETTELQKLIPSGRHIRRVTPREIKLDDGTVITRVAIRDYALSQRARYGDVISDEEYTRKYLTPDSVIENLETVRAKEEHEKQNPVHRSGPPSIVGTPIRQN